MFRKIRRIKNEISLEEAKKLLRENRRAALAVNGDDGYPYTVPINFYYDEAENRIYFHSAKKGHKIDAITASDKVCFTTWDNGYQEEGDWAYYVGSCVVFGRARLVDDPVLAERKLRTFAMKYYPTEQDVEDEIAKDGKGVQMVAIDIEHITGKLVHEK
jgi:hypothetical protein